MNKEQKNAAEMEKNAVGSLDDGTLQDVSGGAENFHKHPQSKLTAGSGYETQGVWSGTND